MIRAGQPNIGKAGLQREEMPVARITLEFIESGGKTTVISTVRYPTKEDRDKVIEMGMEAGIDQTLNRLEAYLAQNLQ